MADSPKNITLSHKLSTSANWKDWREELENTVAQHDLLAVWTLQVNLPIGAVVPPVAWAGPNVAARQQRWLFQVCLSRVRSGPRG